MNLVVQLITILMIITIIIMIITIIVVILKMISKEETFCFITWREKKAQELSTVTNTLKVFSSR